LSADYDVLVAGGGLVGASLACALGGSGLRVAVVEAVALDAADQPSYDDRSVALAWGSRRIFEGMGLWRDICARGACPIHRIHVSDRGRPGFARLAREDMGVPALGYVVENRVLGAALAAGMGERAGVTLFCPARLVGVEVASAGVALRLEGAPDCRARLLVVADGGRSPAREWLGLAVREVDYRQSAVVANVTPGRPHHHVAYERFTPSGPLALLPLTGGRCALVWSLPPAEARAAADLPAGVFLDRLGPAFGDRLGGFRRVGRRAVYPLKRVEVEPPVRPRAVFVGNAAHAVHPVAGQGFNLGLRDVAVLAELLVDAHRRGEDLGGAPLLGEYARRRRRDLRATTWFTDGLVRVFTHPWAPVAAGRDLGLLAVDLVPPLRRALLRRSMGLAGPLPRLARGLALSP